MKLHPDVIEAINRGYKRRFVGGENLYDSRRSGLPDGN